MTARQIAVDAIAATTTRINGAFFQTAIAPTPIPTNRASITRVEPSATDIRTIIEENSAGGRSAITDSNLLDSRFPAITPTNLNKYAPPESTSNELQLIVGLFGTEAKCLALKKKGKEELVTPPGLKEQQQ